MTAMFASAGASSATLPAWEAIDWQKAVKHVRQLQMRIAKAFREGKQGKVKALQWILTHSFSAKLLAVKRVVQNRGANPAYHNYLSKWISERENAKKSKRPRWWLCWWDLRKPRKRTEKFGSLAMAL